MRVTDIKTMKSITYSLDFQHHEAPPSQKQFETLLVAMSTFDTSFDELLNFMEEHSIFEKIALNDG